MTDNLKAIVKLFETFRYKHDLYAAFSDWCECAAISISNAADLSHRDKREARYLELARKYERAELDTFTISSVNSRWRWNRHPVTFSARCFTPSSCTTRREANSSHPIPSAR